MRNAHADESDRLGLSVDAPPPPAADFKVSRTGWPRTCTSAALHLARLHCAVSAVQVIMAGNLAVGKSCLLHRFTAGKWDSTIQPTIGAQRRQRFGLAFRAPECIPALSTPQGRRLCRKRLTFPAQRA